MTGVDVELQEMWRELRNDCSARAQDVVRGCIDMLERLGLLTSERAELWQRRLDTCPGHDDEGGRVWCAYCGALWVEEGRA